MTSPFAAYEERQTINDSATKAANNRFYFAQPG